MPSNSTPLLNIRGEYALLDACRRWQASLVTDRAPVQAVPMVRQPSWR